VFITFNDTSCGLMQNLVNGRVNCRVAVNVLQRCQVRLLSSEGQKPLSSPDRSNPDIPKGGSSQSNNTTRNILIGVGAVAIVAGVYYVSSASVAVNILKMHTSIS